MKTKNNKVVAAWPKTFTTFSFFQLIVHDRDIST